MPREIFADEIERFLEGLDGVSSARVLTGPKGDISYVYVTTENASDSRGLRHGVLAALQSRFGIPIDDWRVRVTQLRAGVQPNEIPHFRVARVEETATTADLAVTVKLQWTRGSDVRSATGQARGRGGAAQRPRALAAATIAAVRDALDVPHGDLSLDRVGTVTFLDRPVVLVALSTRVSPPGHGAGEPQTFVGTAFNDAAFAAGTAVPDERVEPAITAALDGVTRWLLEAAFVVEPSRSQLRRDRLESMRHFVQDAAPDPGPGPRRTPQHGGPGASTEFHDIAADGGPGDSRTAPVRALPPRRLDAVHGGPGRVDPPARESGPVDGGPRPGPRATGPQTGGPAPDGAGGASLALGLRREPKTPAGTGAAGGPASDGAKGGTEMALQHDTPDAGSGVRAGRGSGVEDGFYRSLVVERTPVHLRCRDGYEVAGAIVRDAGTYALLVETPDGLELFFKHAIISIRVLSKPAAQA
jgi:sRNA-binding regulator protein Hfq